MRIRIAASEFGALLMVAVVVMDPWSPRPALGQALDDASAQPKLGLSLVEAIRIAFDNNLDIRVVRYERALAQERVTSSKGQFEPFVFLGVPGAGTVNPFPGGGGFGGGAGFGGFGFSDITNPSSTALAGANTVTSESVAALLDFQHTLESGTRYDISYNVSRSTTNSAFQSLNPAFSNTLAVSVLQPLLSGRGRDVAAVDLLVAQANTRVSEFAFRAQAEQILLQVERAYWQLVFAERDVQVKESSLGLAREQLERTAAQVEVGLIAPVQSTQAEVQVAARETELILARNALADAGDELRAMLRAETLPGGWDTALEPTDGPEIVIAPVDVAVAIATALENRPEIDQGAAAVAVRAVQVKASSNALMPRVDLLAQLSTNGIGGDLVVRDGFPGEIIDVIPGGYGDAVDQLTGLDFTSWSLGVNVTLPIGNSTARGNHAQATLNEDQARTELERIKQQVTMEVRRAARGVTAAADAMVSAARTSGLAERQLEIETDRFDVGMTTNFEVLRFQDDLTTARSAELRAVIGHRLAVAELRRATGTLLDQYGIRLR